MILACLALLLMRCQRHTLIASASCFASGVDHFLSSCRLEGVADKLLELWYMKLGVCNTGLRDACPSPARAVRKMVDLMSVKTLCAHFAKLAKLKNTERMKFQLC